MRKLATYTFLGLMFYNVSFANNLPDALFGVKLFDNIKNYDIKKKFEQKRKDGTRHRDFYVLNSVPIPNDSFEEYAAITLPDNNKIVSVRGKTNVIDYNVPLNLFIEQKNKEPDCTSIALPKYISAMSSAWQIWEKAFSRNLEFYGYQPLESLKSKFLISENRRLNYKKNDNELVAVARCKFINALPGGEVYGTTITDPSIYSFIEVIIATREYADQYKPTKIYRETFGDLLRKLDDAVSLKGF